MTEALPAVNCGLRPIGAPASSGATRKAQDPARVAGFRGGRVRLSDHEAMSLCEDPEQRQIPGLERGCDRRARLARREGRAQKIRAVVVGGKRRAEPGRLARQEMRVWIARKRAHERHEKDDTGDDGGDRISRQAEDRHRAEPAVDQRPAGPHGDPPESELHALAGERRLDEISVADGGAAERDENVGGGRPRRLDAGFERGEIIADDSEIDRLAPSRLV